MTRLNKVYKWPGWNDYYGFRAWMDRTNPNMGISLGEEYKVAVSMKFGKRRKLRMMIVKVVDTGCGDPQCCGFCPNISFERPKTPVVSKSKTY